jgi:hypothetical protein
MTVFMQGAVRFEAEWIAKQHADANGEWNPDRDEHAVSSHATKEAAETAAIRESQRAGQCEWILVAEQKFIGYEWIDQRRWTGDWDGLHEETYSVEAESR